MGNLMCTQGLKVDMNVENESSKTKDVGTKEKETLNIRKGNTDANGKSVKIVKQQGGAKIENADARTMNAGKKPNAKDTLHTSIRNKNGTSRTDLLQVEPKSELNFKGPFSEVVTVPMTLKNTSTTESVCFKVTTTAPRQYCVRPNKGIIQPQETVSVQVMLQPRDYDPNKKYKEKMRVESFVVSKENAKTSNTDALWKNVDKDQLYMVTLRCVFEEPSESPPMQNDISEVLADAKKSVSGPSNEGYDNRDCGPCKTEGKISKASEFCKVCKTFVCESCKSCHNKFDMLWQHSFVPANVSIRDNLSKDKTEDLSKCRCCTGDNNVAEYYCENHKQFICLVCACLEHKDCKDCISISSDLLLSYADVDDMMIRAKSLKEEIQNQMSNQSEFHFSIETEKEIIKEEVAKFKTDIDEWVANHETNFLNELDAETANRNAITLLLDNMINTINADGDLLRNNRNETVPVKTFILQKKLLRNINDFEKINQDLKAGTVPQLIFKRNEKLESMMKDIKSFGKTRLIPRSSTK